jgi:hypothetical protein
MEINAHLWYWSALGMVRYQGHPDQRAFIEKAEVERLLGEVHRKAFEAGKAAGVEESAEVVRQTQIRPG